MSRHCLSARFRVRAKRSVALPLGRIPGSTTQLPRSAHLLPLAARTHSLSSRRPWSRRSRPSPRPGLCSPSAGTGTCPAVLVYLELPGHHFSPTMVDHADDRAQYRDLITLPRHRMDGRQSRASDSSPRWAIHGPLRPVNSGQRRASPTAAVPRSGPPSHRDNLVPKLMIDRPP
jgi:hypothetical protein